ncbi:unnamed protein product, partial [Prorocentrum cordatum]
GKAGNAQRGATGQENWKMPKERRQPLTQVTEQDAAGKTNWASDAAELTPAIKAHAKVLMPHRRRILHERKEAAGTGIGIKNRSYRADPFFSPSAKERAQFSARRAEASDMRCEQLGGIDERAHLDNNDATAYLRQAARKDFEMTAK